MKLMRPAYRRDRNVFGVSRCPAASRSRRSAPTTSKAASCPLQRQFATDVGQVDAAFGRRTREDARAKDTDKPKSMCVHVAALRRAACRTRSASPFLNRTLLLSQRLSLRSTVIRAGRRAASIGSLDAGEGAAQIRIAVQDEELVAQQRQRPLQRPAGAEQLGCRRRSTRIARPKRAAVAHGRLRSARRDDRRTARLARRPAASAARADEI